MANLREVFTVLEKADGSGESWKSQAEGDAVASVELAPVVAAKDEAGQFVLIPVSASGQTPGDLIPTLPAVDKDGNLIQIPVEIEGEDVGNAVPVLVAKDTSGDLAYIPLNADGEVIVSSESAGTYKNDEGVGTGVINTDVEAVSLTLTADKVHENIEVITSCSFTTLWRLEQVNDAATTVLARWLTGPGSFSFEKLFKTLIVTAGSTGTQELNIIGVQLQGTGSDLNAYVGALEKA